MAEGEKDHWDEDKYIRQVELEDEGAGKKSLWVHVKNWVASQVSHCKGSTDGGTTWVPLKVDADGKVIVVAA